MEKSAILKSREVSLKESQTKSLFSPRFEFGTVRTRILFFLGILILSGTYASMHAQVIRKSPVEFYSTDSLLVRADNYYSNRKNPYILLFHQENSSRGEFDSIAVRFAKMKYNCLAVDLRNGDGFAFVDNITARRAREKNLPPGVSVENDILAAIDFVYNRSGQKVIILGSSYSATLCLKIAGSDDRVKAVMAFSPGEFLRPEFSMDDLFSLLHKPVYLACSLQEYPYMLSAIKNMEEGHLSMIRPPEKTTNRGIPLLFNSNPGNDEYWLSVLIFIKSLQN